MSAKLYILTGLPYSGKTTLTKKLVKRFGFRTTSVDDQINFHEFEVEDMTQDDWNLVYSEAYEQAQEMLEKGENVIFDMGHLEKHERDNARNIAKSANAESVLIYLNISLEEVKQRRLKNTETQERDHLEDETMDRALSKFEEPTPDENPIIYNQNMNLDEWIDKNIIV